VIEEDSRKRVGSLLVDRMAGVQHDLNPALRNCGGEAARRCDVAMIELSGHERARERDSRQVFPKRLHLSIPANIGRLLQ
jgi:hypothetical protein